MLRFYADSSGHMVEMYSHCHIFLSPLLAVFLIILSCIHSFPLSHIYIKISLSHYSLIS